MAWNSPRGIGAPALCLLLLAGCGDGTPARTPVRGQVYYQGRPLAHGLIVFTPDADRGGSGPSAKGDIQPDGSYHLSTDGHPGVVVGWHRVAVAAVERPPVAGQPYQRPRTLLPNRYSDPALSGQVREVRPGKENVIDFYLE